MLSFCLKLVLFASALDLCLLCLYLLKVLYAVPDLLVTFLNILHEIYNRPRS